MTGLTMIVIMGMVVLMVWAMISPPSWLKPPWLRAEERRLKQGLPSGIPYPPEGPVPVVSRKKLILQLVGLAAFAIAWIAFGLPPHHLLVGFGLGLPILIATKVKG